MISCNISEYLLCARCMAPSDFSFLLVLVLFYFIFSLYLRGRVKDMALKTSWDKESKRACKWAALCWFTPQIPTLDRVGLGWTQKAGAKSRPLLWVAEMQLLDPSPVSLLVPPWQLQSGTELRSSWTWTSPSMSTLAQRVPPPGDLNVAWFPWHTHPYPLSINLRTLFFENWHQN